MWNMLVTPSSGTVATIFCKIPNANPFKPASVTSDCSGVGKLGSDNTSLDFLHAVPRIDKVSMAIMYFFITSALSFRIEGLRQIDRSANWELRNNLCRYCCRHRVSGCPGCLARLLLPDQDQNI